MANQIFANGMAVSCKAAAGKTICAFPDVCFTPPQTPATPPGVPIPYPNTGMASDTTGGTKKVKISGKEVGLKNVSCFKKSTGDEAGSAPKKGIITSQNRGKVYFNSWSMDVKFEGKNAVRHLDLTTNNHASMPGDTPTWPYIDTMAVSAPEHPCVEDQSREMQACQDFKPHGDEDPCPPDKWPEAPAFADCRGDLSDDEIEQLTAGVQLPSLRGIPGSGTAKNTIDALKDKYKNSVAYQEYRAWVGRYVQKLSQQTAANECLRARRCMLVPYEPAAGQTGCCSTQTPHHLVEASSFFDKGRGGADSEPLAGCGGYDAGKAPCICVEGTTQYEGTHGLMHTFQGNRSAKNARQRKQSLGQASAAGAEAVGKVFPESNCAPECLESQIKAFHNAHDIKDDQQILAKAPGHVKDTDVAAARQAVEAMKRDVYERAPVRS